LGTAVDAARHADIVGDSLAERRVAGKMVVAEEVLGPAAGVVGEQPRPGRERKSLDFGKSRLKVDLVRTASELWLLEYGRPAPRELRSGAAGARRLDRRRLFHDIRDPG